MRDSLHQEWQAEMREAQQSMVRTPANTPMGLHCESAPTPQPTRGAAPAPTPGNTSDVSFYTKYFNIVWVQNELLWNLFCCNFRKRNFVKSYIAHMARVRFMLLMGNCSPTTHIVLFTGNLLRLGLLRLELTRYLMWLTSRSNYHGVRLMHQFWVKPVAVWSCGQRIGLRFRERYFNLF